MKKAKRKPHRPYIEFLDPNGTPPSLSSVIQHLVSRFQDSESGELAEIRRLDPRNVADSVTGSFYRVVAYELEPARKLNGFIEDQAIRRWATILQGLVMVYDLEPSENATRLGTAMCKAEVSEARLIRLLRAEGEQLLAQVRPIAHQLRSAKEPALWDDMAWLVLREGKPEAEKARHDIASSYYRQEYKQSKEQDARSV